MMYGVQLDESMNSGLLLLLLLNILCTKRGCVTWSTILTSQAYLSAAAEPHYSHQRYTTGREENRDFFVCSGFV